MNNRRAAADLDKEQGALLTLPEISAELRAIERDLRDLREMIDAAAPDIAEATRLRVRRRGLLKRQEELQNRQLDILRAA